MALTQGKEAEVEGNIMSYHVTGLDEDAPLCHNYNWKPSLKASSPLEGSPDHSKWSAKKRRIEHPEWAGFVRGRVDGFPDRRTIHSEHVP